MGPRAHSVVTGSGPCLSLDHDRGLLRGSPLRTSAATGSFNIPGWLRKSRKPCREAKRDCAGHDQQGREPAEAASAQNKKDGFHEDASDDHCDIHVRSAIDLGLACRFRIGEGFHITIRHAVLGEQELQTSGPATALKDIVVGPETVTGSISPWMGSEETIMSFVVAYSIQFTAPIARRFPLEKPVVFTAKATKLPAGGGAPGKAFLDEKCNAERGRLPDDHTDSGHAAERHTEFRLQPIDRRNRRHASVYVHLQRRAAAVALTHFERHALASNRVSPSASRSGRTGR